ncbi:uncharacterized protein LOC131253689 isoform X2 [Magnolia sinica]|uniref:uncharacterized protein LOC131253689 isoform X2 n=1 Tax=Magnolia sinica TaxID=86752 RepID=UPI00265B3EE5|nr:uncharacterized protein LOC131253689 isoform X2 [Magnolia sinica]
MEEESGQRRSARLSALDTCKVGGATRGVGPGRAPRGRGGAARRGRKRARDGVETGSGQGLPGKKRGRKKKRLTEVEEVTVISVKEEAEEAVENLEHDDCSSHNIDKSSSGASRLPEKQVLERILDMLQKKDAHEIFSEPVKPDEVEGYYDIIENPMDFGTMRAKLQEQMYKTLEQFEARSIHDLAKKVFHALRTNPENFELELATMRRRPGRTPKNHASGKGQGEATSTGNPTVDVSSSGRHRSLNGQSGVRRNLREGLTVRGPSHNVDRRITYEDLCGLRDGRKSNFSEEERRDTYRPGSFSSLAESIFSTRNSPLIYVNQGNFNYSDSLMRFAADLGPTAKVVAQRKLQRCQTPAMPALPGPTPATGIDNIPAHQILLNAIAGHPGPLAGAANRNDMHKNFTEMCRWNQRSRVPPSCYIPPAHFGSSNDARDAIIEMGQWNQRSDVPSCSYLPAVHTGNSNDTRDAIIETGRWSQRSDIPSCSYLSAAHTRNLNDTNDAIRETGHWNSNDTRDSIRETGRWSPSSDIPSCSYLPAAHTGNSNDTRDAVRETGRWNPSSDVLSCSYLQITHAGNLNDTSTAVGETGHQNPSLDVPSCSYLPAGASADIDIGNLNFPAAGIEITGNNYMATHIGNSNFPATEVPSSHTSYGGPHVGNSDFPAAMVPNPTTDYMATHIGSSKFLAAVIPNASNEYMAMMAASGMLDAPVPPSKLASDLSQSRLLELVSRNNNSPALPPSLSWAFQEAMKMPVPSQAADPMQALNLFSLEQENQAVAALAHGYGENQAVVVPDQGYGENQAVVAPGLSHDGLGSAPTADQCSTWVQPESWGAPQTVLDIPFLQSRLGEMSLWGRNGLLRPELPPASTAQETPFFDAMGDCERGSGSHGGHRPEPSSVAMLDNQHPDLALQL